MRVFLAGATGVIGRPLVPALLAAGHEVTALARTPEKAAALEARGAQAARADASDVAAGGQGGGAAVRAGRNMAERRARDRLGARQGAGGG